MATFHRCARVVADAARELGLADEERLHRDLAARIGAAFQARWFDGISEYRNFGSPQTAHGMALVEGLVPGPLVPAVLGRLVADLQARQGQQTSGDVGHAYLLQALAAHDRSDLLHDLVRRTNLGSYGFIVRNGWTSLSRSPGRRHRGLDESLHARSHPGMVSRLGRRSPPRSDHARLPPFPLWDPHPGGDLTWARGSYDSIRGPIFVEWRHRQGRFQLRIDVPAHTIARLRLPSAAGTAVTEGGRPVGDQAEIRSLGRTGGSGGLRNRRWGIPLRIAIRN